MATSAHRCCNMFRDTISHFSQAVFDLQPSCFIIKRCAAMFARNKVGHQVESNVMYVNEVCDNPRAILLLF